MSVTVSITKGPLSLTSISKHVQADEAGGTVIFVGTVRNSSEGMKKVTAIELEAAEELAKKDLLRIACKAESRYKLSKLAVTHRVGKMKVGDSIVVIAVSAPHRKEAFAACKFVIDELKKSTPIWKKEYGVADSRWVGPER